MSLSEKQQIRYSRVIIMDEVGEVGQERICRGRVLIVGLGGLGCPTVMYLAAGGVKQLQLVDDDLVEESNLARQILYGEEDVGRPKVSVAREKISEINSECEVVVHREKVDKNNVDSLVENTDIVVDGTDTISSRLLLSDSCYKYRKPLVFGALQGYEGEVGVFWPQGAETVGAETVGAETVGAETVGAETVGTGTVGAETVGAETVGAETVGAETVGAETVGAETVGAETVGAETVGTETVGAETVGTETVGTETVGAETVGAETVGTETVGAETVGTETVGTENGGDSAGGMEALGETSCLRCLYREAPRLPSQVGRCDVVGVWGPLVGVIGSMQALAVLQLFAHPNRVGRGRLLLFDGKEFRAEKFIVPKDKNCPICSKV